MITDVYDIIDVISEYAGASDWESPLRMIAKKYGLNIDLHMFECKCG